MWRVAITSLSHTNELVGSPLRGSLRSPQFLPELHALGRDRDRPVVRVGNLAGFLVDGDGGLDPEVVSGLGDFVVLEVGHVYGVF